LHWRQGSESGIPSSPVAPATDDLPAIPFQISKELLQSLASSNGATAKLLQSARTEGPSVPSSASRTAKKDPSATPIDAGSGAAKSPVAVAARPESTRAAPSNAVLQVPSAALQATGKTTDGKTALEYEAVIFGLKQRLHEADEEVKRLTTAMKKSRQLESDMFEANALLQSERDYYRIRAGEIHQVDTSSSVPPLSHSAIGEAESVLSTKLGSSHLVERSIIEMVAGYIQQIEQLKASAAHTTSVHKALIGTSMFNSLPRSLSEDGNLDMNNLTTTVIGMGPTDPLGREMFDSNVLVLENDLTSSVARVISQTQKELHEEQRKLLLAINGATTSGTNDIEGSLGDLAEERGMADNVYIDVDSNAVGDIHKRAGTDVEDEDRAFRRRQQDMSTEVIGLSSSIQLKEQLLLQLQRSQRQYEMMKLFYENKLQELAAEVLVHESEKTKVINELTELSKRAVRTTREDDLRKQLTEKEEQLKRLHAKQQELHHHAQIQSRSLQQISKLENDIEQMKRQRVDLMRNIHTEKKKHLAALNQKAREIEKLKSELVRVSAEVKRVSKEKEKAERMTRDALKEGADLRKKVSDISRQSSYAAETAARAQKKTSAIRPTAGPAAFRPVGRNLITEEELRTKRWLDKALQKIAAREQAADSLRRQYEQQLALLNQKKELEGSRSSLREVVTGRKMSQGVEGGSGSSNDVSGDMGMILSSEEEDALREIEERIQNVEGQLISRKLRIDKMQQELQKSAENGSDNAIELLQKKSSQSLPAAQEIIRLMFEMLVTSKYAQKDLYGLLEKSQNNESRLKIECEDLRARVLCLQRAHDIELTKLNSEFEEKLSGLINFSDVGQLMQFDSAPRTDVNQSSGVKSSAETESLCYYFDESEAASANREKFCKSRSISRGFELDLPLDAPKDIDRRNSGEFSSKSNNSQARALLALSNERNVILKDQLNRESIRVRQLQSDVEELEGLRQSLEMQLNTKECDLRFLQEECRMLREVADEYKARVLALEGGQGESIVRTVSQLDKIKRGEMGLSVRFGDDPTGYDGEEHGLTAAAFSDSNRENHSDDDSDEMSAFEHLSEEISKTGQVNNRAGHFPSGSGHDKHSNSGGNTSIFDRLANPSYFTGTQKKLFQRDYLESKRAKVQQIKKDETVRRKKDENGGISGIGSSSNHFGNIDDEATGYHDDPANVFDDRPLRSLSGAAGEFEGSSEVRDDIGDTGLHRGGPLRTGSFERNAVLSRGGSGELDDIALFDGQRRNSIPPIDNGNEMPPESSEKADDRHVDASKISRGMRSRSPADASHPEQYLASDGVLSTSAGKDDVFSRLLNPSKFTGIHKANAVSLGVSAKGEGAALSSGPISPSEDVFLRLQKQNTKTKAAAHPSDHKSFQTAPGGKKEKKSHNSGRFLSGSISTVPPTPIVTSRAAHEIGSPKTSPSHRANSVFTFGDPQEASSFALQAEIPKHNDHSVNDGSSEYESAEQRNTSSII
jgi:hypothetical protein